MNTVPPKNTLSPRPLRTLISAIIAIATAVMVLDLGWLGIVARDFYNEALGPLKSPKVYWPAALLFYAMYVTSIWLFAVKNVPNRITAAKRGAALGFVAYSTYEFTNWAVITDWPAKIVAVDIIWGMILTATAALSGFQVYALTTKERCP